MALALIALGANAWPTVLLLGRWGLVETALLVAWWTWLNRTLPHDAEGGGLMVAVVQLAITLGGAGGGLLHDAGGYRVSFAASAVLLAAPPAVGILDARRALVRKVGALEQGVATDRDKESHHV